MAACAVNLLDIARAAGFPASLDPFIAKQLAVASGTLSQGTLQPIDLVRNELAFQIPTRPTNLYPTSRVDWQVSPALAVRGILNLQWRDLARNPQFPGLEFVNAGFKSNYYIVSTAADWTPRPNLFNQFSFGVQSNHEEFNPGNTDAVFGGGLRVPFPGAATPLQLTSVLPTNDVLPQPRNNPVFNAIDTVTLLRGRHTYTFGGSFRRTTMWEQAFGGGAAGGPGFNLGVATGDPVSAIFSAATIPGIRTTDLPTALLLYGFLTGRISSISGTNNIDENTHQYALAPVVRREAQTVSGVYAQDSWRASPRLTVNYGLRWEFTGTMHNTNGIYTNPTIENLLGPSKTPFKPGTLDGVRDPQIEQRSSPYTADLVNPAPNVGFAWSPAPEGGVLGKLFGNGKSVIRASAGVNYYDEGLIAFQTAAGGNPGLTQSLTLNPGQPGFAPGGLSLSSPIPPLSTFPTAFQFPLPESLFTFARGFNTIDPDIRTPYILNWSIGLQRELAANAAFEARYGRQSRLQALAVLRSQRGQHHRERVRAGVQERAEEPRHQRREQPRGIRQQLAARTGAAPDFRGRLRRTRLSGRAACRERLHQRHVPHAAAAGSGGSARLRAGGTERHQSVPVPPAGQHLRSLRRTRIRRAGPLSDQLLPGESLCRRPRQQSADRRRLVPLPRTAVAVSTALRSGPDGHLELHLQPGAYEPLLGRLVHRRHAGDEP